MNSASQDTRIIENFLVISARYLGVNMHDQRDNNFESPLTAFTPERVSIGLNGNQVQLQQGEIHHA